MSLDNIIVGNYGQAVVLTINDTDTDSAADVSAYTTSQHVEIKDPSGNTATKTASFVSDGSDGQVTYTLVENDIDEAGLWHVRAKVVSGSAVLYSEWESADVAE